MCHTLKPRDNFQSPSFPVDRQYFFFFTLALQHGDGCCSGGVSFCSRGPRPASQPFPALRLLSNVAGAAGHPWEQHIGNNQRRQQQRQHQQFGVFQQLKRPGQRQGQRQPQHFRIVEVLHGSSSSCGHLWLHIWRYLSWLDPHRTEAQGRPQQEFFVNSEVEDERLKCYVQRGKSIFNFTYHMYINLGRFLSSALLPLIFFCEYWRLFHTSSCGPLIIL